jgi:hypothetical protein
MGVPTNSCYKSTTWTFLAQSTGCCNDGNGCTSQTVVACTYDIRITAQADDTVDPPANCCFHIRSASGGVLATNICATQLSVDTGQLQLNCMATENSEEYTVFVNTATCTPPPPPACTTGTSHSQRKVQCGPCPGN